jgi:octaprenyl-diphosphate synthase
LPYIYLYEALDVEGKHKLKSLHGKTLTHEEQFWIKTMMHNRGVIQKSYSQAKGLIEEAIRLMDAKGESALSSIAMAMIERDF